jgi:hypothetical protein
MSKVRRQMRQPALHFHPLVVPTPQPGNHERMSQGMERRGIATLTGTDTGPRENDLKPSPQRVIRQTAMMAGYEEGRRMLIVATKSSTAA